MARPRKVDTDSEDAPNPQFLHSYVTTRCRILRNDYQYVIRLAIQLINSTYRQLEMSDIERVRKDVEEEEKLGEDEDSHAEEGLADAVGVLNEFDVVLAEHEGLLASAKEKLAIVEKLSQDIIDKRIALEAVKRGKVMNQDSRVTWLEVVQKIGSVEKISDSRKS